MRAARLAFCVAALTHAAPAVADHRPLRPEERRAYRGRTPRRADRYGPAGDGANVFDVGSDVGFRADDIRPRSARHVVSCVRAILERGIVEVDVRFNRRVHTGFGTRGQPQRSAP